MSAVGGAFRVAVVAVLVACGPGDPDAVAVSIDDLAAGVELVSIDDPGGAVLLAEAFTVDGGPPPGEVAVDRDPDDARLDDPRFDVVLSYRTGGCPALPGLAADVADGELRLEVEIMSTGDPDCPAWEYVEAIRIDLAADAEPLPIDAVLD